MQAHVATVEGTREQIDRFIDLLSSEVSPVVTRRPGFIQSIALIEREAGRGLLITLWESRAAAEASNEQYRREGVTRGVSERVGLRRTVHWYEVASVVRGSEPAH